MITVLAGGVGGGRFLQGLIQVVPQREVTVISNTGDDLEMFGLHVSPDIDIVTYHLAGLSPDEQGWGLAGDSFATLEALSRFGHPTWFHLGDRDLATNLHRTMLLRQNKTLSQATAEIARAFGLEVTILPMTDDRVRTRVVTDQADAADERRIAALGLEVVVTDTIMRDAERKAALARTVMQAIRT